MQQSPWQQLNTLPKPNTIDFGRREANILLMMAIAIILISSLLLINHDQYSDNLFMVLAAADISLFITLFYYLQSRNQFSTGFLISFIVYTLTIFLVYSGGSDNTALYWTMFLPLVIYSIMGVRWGSYYLIVSALSIAYLIYTPDLIIASYGSTEKKRFLMSYMCVGLFSFVNEFFRTKQLFKNKSESQEHQLNANTDPLTGIANRRALDTFNIPQMINNANCFSVIIADVDKFKEVNDGYGHDIGDQALIHIVGVLKTQFRATDLLVRYGGEEFLICLPNANLHQAHKIAEQIKSALMNAPMAIDASRSLLLTCSFGVAIVENNNFEAALKKADKRLYRAKQSGRNTVISAD